MGYRDSIIYNVTMNFIDKLKQKVGQRFSDAQRRTEELRQKRQNRAVETKATQPSPFQLPPSQFQPPQFIKDLQENKIPQFIQSINLQPQKSVSRYTPEEREAQQKKN